MNGTGNTSSMTKQRPAWLKDEPDSELDIRETPTGDAFLLAILAGANRLTPGRVMVIRTDFEPTLLYSILCADGFEYWPERGGNGDWNLQIRRRPQD